jgi:CheY-like chemotaxis protein
LSRPNLTVLVVDDDALICMSTADMLAALGHTPIEAYSGKQALELLGQRQVDVLITDHSMPGMTGLELAQVARAERPTLPVLLASGYGEDDLGSLGDITLLGKPFDERALAAGLEQVLAEPSVTG